MPNHVTSRVTVTGPSADIAALRDLIVRIAPEGHSDAGASMFSFEAVIPMPDILMQSEASSHAEMGASLILYRADRGAPFADNREYWSKQVREGLGMGSNDISEVAAAYLTANPEVEQKGRTRLEAILETGYANWYPWALANWGTKWGAYRYHEIETQADALVFGFETAWSFPSPIFADLATRFPALTFDCICFDEGWNFAGVGTFGATGEPFAEVKATDDLYEQVYGRKPSRDEDLDDG